MSKLYFATHKGSTEDQDHYVCSNYKSNTGSCTIHYIRKKVLTALVLAHLQATIAYVQADEDGFIRLVMDKDAQEQRRELARKKAELTKAEKRVTELDSLFQRVYEDHATDKLTEERYNRLSGSYEAEQRELEARVAGTTAGAGKGPGGGRKRVPLRGASAEVHGGPGADAHHRQRVYQDGDSPRPQQGQRQAVSARPDSL